MEWAFQRARMVEEQLRARGIRDARVLGAFAEIPRHLFVLPDLIEQAYGDCALPIGSGQTISQPYIVALMLEQLRLRGTERVLEIGTGSGYQSAVLSRLAKDVYSMERLPELLRAAQERLWALGIENVHLHQANGSLGWPAPMTFEGIVVSAAAPAVPQPLLAQLASDGRLVMPVGTPELQSLVAIERRGTSWRRREIAGCLFVPLVGARGAAPSEGA